MLLPSGWRVRGELPSFATLSDRGMLDERVISAAARLREDPPKPRETTAEERDLQTYTDALVAGFCREAVDPRIRVDGAPLDPDDPDSWGYVTLDPSDLSWIAPPDRRLLEFLVWHVYTASEVTAIAEATLAGETPEEVAGLDRLAEFRRERHGAARGSDSEGVEHPTVDAVGGGG